MEDFFGKQARAPASWAKGEDMCVMQQAIEHRPDGGAVTEELDPILQTWRQRSPDPLAHDLGSFAPQGQGSRSLSAAVTSFVPV